MILDEARANNRACNIVVTQPRRIAARSIADRVSRERGWDLGTVVGYQVSSNTNNHIKHNIFALFSIRLDWTKNSCLKTRAYCSVRLVFYWKN